MKTPQDYQHCGTRFVLVACYHHGCYFTVSGRSSAAVNVAITEHVAYAHPIRPEPAQ